MMLDMLTSDLDKNEKNLVSSLTESLASEIKNNLINITDDF